MAKTKRSPSSLGRISDTLQQVRRHIAKKKTRPEHKHVQKAALNFIDGINSAVKAFCGQVDPNCVFECVPPSAEAALRLSGAKKKR